MERAHLFIQSPFVYEVLIHETDELHRCQLIRKPCHESQKLSQKFEEEKDEGRREGWY